MVYHVSPIKLEVKVTLPKGTALGSRCYRFQTRVWPQSPVHNHHAHLQILLAVQLPHVKNGWGESFCHVYLTGLLENNDFLLRLSE